MLSPLEICCLKTVGKASVDLPAVARAYSLTTDRLYGPGSCRLARADRRQPMLLFWPNFPVTARTTILGPIPTVEDLHDIEVQAWFNVDRPGDVWQTLLRDRDSLTMEEFCQDLGSRLYHVLLRLASEYSTNALVMGRAQVEGQRLLQAELNRLYSDSGFTVSRVVIQSVQSRGGVLQRDLLLERVRREAEQHDLAWADALEACRQRLGQAAESGSLHAKAALDSLADVASLDDRQAMRGEAEQRVVVGSHEPTGAIELQPLVPAVSRQPGGKFAILSRLQPPRYYAILDRSFTIGSAPHCDVRLSSESVSSEHAVVMRVGSRLALKDCDSSGGTFWEGRRISLRLLSTGDVIGVGEYWLLFNLEPQPELTDADLASDELWAAECPSSQGALPSGSTARAQLITADGRSISSDARPVLIGHDVLCDLRTARQGAGRFHAIVFWDLVPDDAGTVERRLFVEDLHTPPGTLLNGQRVGRAPVADGDILEIGDQRIEIRCRNVQIHTL